MKGENMKKIISWLIAVVVLFPSISFADMTEWKTFIQHQREEQTAFYKQMKQERDDFLKQHPDVAAALAQQAKEAQARAQERAAARRLKGTSPAKSPVPVATSVPPTTTAPVKTGN